MKTSKSASKYNKLSYVEVPVFNRIKDEDFQQLLKPREPPTTVAERRAKAIRRFKASLRFPDSTMNIPFPD